MTRITLTLFGRPEIRLNDQPLTGLNNKAEALVYYLVTTRQVTSRERLAGLLWSNFPEKRARGNLRVELGKLRPLLGNHLHIQRQSVAFAFTSDHHIDVNRFEELLDRPSPTAAEIEEAHGLYKGDFLEDFSLKGAPLFEEWQLAQQERFRQTVLGALQRLSAGYGRQKQYDDAITAARHLLTIEPWSEAGHQALMRWYTLSGQKLSALAQYDLCCELLMAELATEPSDETELLYNQILTGQLAEDPATANLPLAIMPTVPVPFQPLPPSQTFVGREQEIGRVRAVLSQSDGARPVALVGMGGIGKTTLANQISHALRDEFTDGVLWANAATVEPLDILQSWGQAYGFDFSGISDLKNCAAAVRGVLADKKVLVVLDDVVQVARIRPLLPNGEQCAVILTTRDLDVATVLSAEVVRVDELSLENGRQLLQEILGEARVAAEPEAAEAICLQLQLHPLALEITAMRLKSRQRRSLASMAERLHKMEQRLGLELKDRAVRASFEVSWRALAPELREVFVRLAVFEERPFTATAVAFVLDADEYDAEDHLYTLSALSLIREEGEVRFKLHPLLADFAAEKIGSNKGESNERMAIYFQQFAATHQQSYDQLEPEWSNVLAGMRVAHDHASWGLVLAYAHTLVEPWFNRGRFNDVRRGMVWGEAAAQAIYETADEAFVILKHGQACVIQHDHQTAEHLLKKSLALYRTIGDQEKVAEILFTLGRIAYEQSQYEEALDLLQESYDLSEAVNDPIGAAKALGRQARVWAAFGERLKAKQLGQQALQRIADTEAHLWQLSIVRVLAEIALQEKEIEAAGRYCQQALALCTLINSESELASVHYLLSTFHSLQGAFDAAKQHAYTSLDLYKKLGNIRGEGLILFDLGWTLKDANELPEAINMVNQSLEIALRLNDKIDVVFAYRLLGDCYQLQGEAETAQAHWQTALSSFGDVVNPELKKSILSRLQSVS